MGISYLGSYPSILKLVQMMCNIVLSISIILTSITTKRTLTIFTASAAGIFITLIFLIVKTFDIDKRINVPWHRIEIGYCVTWTLYMIYTIPEIIISNNDVYKLTGITALLGAITYVAVILECWEENKEKERNTNLQ